MITLWLCAGYVYFIMIHLRRLLMYTILTPDEVLIRADYAIFEDSEPYPVMLIFLFLYSYVHYVLTDDIEIFLFKFKMLTTKYGDINFIYQVGTSILHYL